MTIKEIERVSATGQKDPNVQVLVCYQEYIVSSDEDGVSMIPRFKYWETMLRQKVNQISDTQFEVPATGEILTRI
jgi:hypothetical protein